MARQPGCGDRGARQVACPVLALQAARAGQRGPGELPGHRHHAVHQHHPPRIRAVVPGRRTHRASNPPLHPLERGGHRGASEQAGRRNRRPPQHVRQLRQPVRDRLQPLLPRQGRRHRRRPRVLPGACRPRRVCPRIPRAPAGGIRPGELPPRDRSRREGSLQLPTPASDARVLGVSHRQHGPRPDHRALPGALQPLHAEP
ncbi:unannotated protein [freshwater metagenome]|uniref:Unannotated protein n=1 Tax=freshwater metagenome TaxID=449393 RepID=A0A6J7ARR8_9ZZZZ